MHQVTCGQSTEYYCFDRTNAKDDPAEAIGARLKGGMAKSATADAAMSLDTAVAATRVAEP
jgi:hypothetical protein